MGNRSTEEPAMSFADKAFFVMGAGMLTNIFVGFGVLSMGYNYSPFSQGMTFGIGAILGVTYLIVKVRGTTSS